MGENTVQFSTAGGQSPEAGRVGQPTGDQGTPQAGNTTPTGLDADALFERIDKRIQESVNGAFRGLQSAQSKMETRIRSEIDSRLNLLTQSGVELNDQQKLAIANATRRQIEAEGNGGDDPGANGSAQSDAQGQRNPSDRRSSGANEGGPNEDFEWVNQQAGAMMQSAGVEIDQGDPEAGMIDMSDPNKFLDTLKAAIEKKRERLGNTAQGRMPMMGGGGRSSNPIADIKDMNTLYDMALTKKR